MNWVIFLSMFFLCVGSNDILDLTDENFDFTIYNNQYVLVEFYAKDCENCKAFTHEYEMLAVQIKNSGRPCIIARINDQLYPKQSKGAHVFEYPTDRKSVV